MRGPARFWLTFVLASAIASPCAAGGVVFCPAGSTPDHPWRRGDDSTRCVAGQQSGTPQRDGTVDYDVFCAGRMTQADAERVGRQIGAQRGRMLEGSNPIVRDAARERMTPQYVGVVHRAHFGCNNAEGAGVATHLKLRVRWRYEGRDVVGWLAEGCEHHGSQNGSIALGARMDREYACRRQIRAGERGATVWNVAADLVRRDLLAQARALRGKVCVLVSSDIQCAPCDTSDKLIVRVQTVPRDDRCPGHYPRLDVTAAELR